MERSKLYKEIYRDWLYSHAQFGSTKMCEQWLKSLSKRELRRIINEDDEVIPDDVIAMAEDVLADKELLA